VLDHIEDLHKKFRWGQKQGVEVLKVLFRKKIKSGSVYITPDVLKRMKDLYLAEVRYVDRELERIIDALKESGRLDNTVIIITADHGEEFFEHGNFDHSHSVYNELAHIPLIVHLPGGPTGRLKTVVRSIDIAPTILDVANVGYDESEFQGRTLLSVIRGEETTDRDALTESCFEYEERKALVSDGYKLIWRPLTDRFVLFDLKRDPKELEPITTGHEEIFSKLKSRMFDILEQSAAIHRRITGASSERIDEHDRREMEEKFKSMGYVD